MTIVRHLPSPVGDLLLAGDDEILSGLYFADHRPSPRLEGSSVDPSAFANVVQQLEEWFAGERTAFQLAFELDGTPFQRRVWAALAEVPYATTVTYGDLAGAAGRPGAARAIGHAVARNPVSIIVPCHRVMGTGGALTGYAGGVSRKRLLLDHEQGVAARSPA